MKQRLLHELKFTFVAERLRRMFLLIVITMPSLASSSTSVINDVDSNFECILDISFDGLGFVQFIKPPKHL